MAVEFDFVLSSGNGPSKVEPFTMTLNGSSATKTYWTVPTNGYLFITNLTATSSVITGSAIYDITWGTSNNPGTSDWLSLNSYMKPKESVTLIDKDMGIVVCQDINNTHMWMGTTTGNVEAVCTGLAVYD